MSHPLNRIHDSLSTYGRQHRATNGWDVHAARRAQARSLRSARRTLERHELMLGLAMFIATTNERPPLDDVKAAFAGHTPRTARTRYADIADLL